MLRSPSLRIQKLYMFIKHDSVVMFIYTVMFIFTVFIQFASCIVVASPIKSFCQYQWDIKFWKYSAALQSLMVVVGLLTNSMIFSVE